MTDWSFIAMRGPGSATETVRGGNSSTRSVKPVAVADARVGLDVEAIGRIAGKIVDLLLRDLQDVDLHVAEGSCHQSTRRPARRRTGRQQELELRGFALGQPVHRIEVGRHAVRRRAGT
ncbi:hypothetical protein BJF78_16815 [Pseudonocardia sp. CNS-139]|nr:hypothetical protein BJF78_16815 [Pseudonocardia sp. CNS-139]